MPQRNRLADFIFRVKAKFRRSFSGSQGLDRLLNNRFVRQINKRIRLFIVTPVQTAWRSFRLFLLYHPHSLYAGALVAVLGSFLAYLYLFYGWRWEWNQIGTWANTHKAIVLVWLETPFVIIAFLNWINHSFKLHFHRGLHIPNKVAQQRHHAFVSLAVTVFVIFGLVLYFSTIPVLKASGCPGTTNITSNTTWSTNQCLGDVTVSNSATLTINGGITADLVSLTLGNGVTNGFITAKGDTVNNRGVVINIDNNFEVKAASSISANSQGYPTPNQGPGAGIDQVPLTAAGHGGQGRTADANTTTSGNTYGSVKEPTTLGSSSYSTAGGGAVKLSIGGNAIVAGNITADASGSGAGSAGMGAGGSVWLNFTGGASGLSGAGSITANGGAGSGSGYGGGGGRVAITGHTSSTHSGTVRAAGGRGVSEIYAAAGTVYMKSTAETNGTLIVDNAGFIPQDNRITNTGNNTPFDTLIIRNFGTVTFVSGNTLNATTTTISTNGVLHPHIAHNIGGAITLQSNGFISHATNTNAQTYTVPGLTMTNLTIDSGGAVYTDADGYTTTYSGPGAGSPAGPIAGAGHGGQGGTNDTSAGAGNYYGSAAEPTTIGSSAGTAGGGAVKLNISGNIVNNGTITANAAANGSGVALGAGGSIWLNFTGGASALSGSGSITANGGASASAGGGGGGGRIAITGYTSNTLGGTINATGGNATTSRVGAAGTIYMRSTSETNGTLISDNGGTFTPQDLRITGTGNITVDTLTIRNRGIITSRTSNTVTATSATIATNGRLHAEADTSITTLTVQNTGVVSHNPNTNAETNKITNLSLGTLTIDNGGSINVDGKGYTTTYSGPGAGQVSPTTTAAGHGGQGGTNNASTSTVGLTYDSVTAPSSIGSSATTAGGGAVKLTISGNATVNGTITAGGTGTGLAQDHGSGGSIHMVFTGGSSALSGSSSITATGGGGNGNGRGGGGGRVAITGYTSNTLAGAIQAAGGQGAITAHGSPGTVYTKSASTNGTLTLDNATRTQQTGRYTEVNSTVVADTLTITSGANYLHIGSSGALTAANDFTLSGTIRNRGALSLTGALTIANGAFLTADTATTLGSVTVQSGGKINHSANATSETHKIDITASSLTVNSGGSIDLAGLGYTGGGASVTGNGPGGGGAASDGTSSGGGAGHGTTGTAGGGGAPGSAGSSYGSASAPVTIGAGGGGGASSAGGAGGGAVKLTVTNAVTVNGTINANGASGVVGAYGGGGGSGGSVWITANSLTCGASTITASGGNGAGTTISGGPGAGGRFALAIAGSTSCTPGAGGGSTYQAPNAPTNVAASSYTATTISMAWKDNSSTETNFKIHDASHTQLATKTSTTTSSSGTDYTQVASNLTPNTLYVIHIHADDGVGESAPSNTVSIRTLAATPASVTLSNHLNGSLNLVFDPSTNASTIEYAIQDTVGSKYVQTDGTLGTSPVWQTRSAWGGASGITVTGLSRGTLYTFGVKSRNSDGVASPYQSASTVEPITPLAPVLFDPAATELGLAIEVDGNVSVVEYAIFESTTSQYVSTLNSGIFAHLGSSPLWKTYFDWGEYFGINVMGLTANTTYKFSVKARYPGGTESVFGPEATMATNNEAVSTGDSSASSPTSSTTGGSTSATTTEASASSSSPPRSSSGSSSSQSTEEPSSDSESEPSEVTFPERKRLTFAEFYKAWMDYWIEQQYDWWDSNSFFGGAGWFGSNVGGSIGWGTLPWGKGRGAGGYMRTRGGFGAGGGGGGRPGGGGGFDGGGGGGGGPGGGGFGRGLPGKLTGTTGKISRGIRSAASLGRSLMTGSGEPFMEAGTPATGRLFRFPSGPDKIPNKTTSGPGSTGESGTSGDIPFDSESYSGPPIKLDERLQELLTAIETLIKLAFPNPFNPHYNNEILTIADDYYALISFMSDIFAQTRIASYLEEVGLTKVNRFVGGLAIVSFAAPLIHLLASVAAPLAGLIPGATSGGFWFNVLSWRKRRKSWGRVVSSLTGKGVSGAVVSLYNAGTYNRLVDRATTNRFGRFGFLVAPGRYVLQVSHPKFRYPSTSFAGGYRGQIVTIAADGVIQVDIPVDPLKVSSAFITTGEVGRLLVEILRRLLLILGTTLSLYNISRETSVLNIVFLIYYIALWIWELARKKDSHNAITILDAMGKPVGYAIVRLMNSDGEVVFTKASGPNGKVFIMVQEGDYTLDVSVPALGAHVRQYVELSNGILPKPLTIRLGQTQPVTKLEPSATA